MYNENYEQTWFEKWRGNCSRGYIHCYCIDCKENRKYDHENHIKYEEDKKLRKEIRDWDDYLKNTKHPW